MFTVTFEIDTTSRESVIKLMESVLRDQRTVSFSIKEQEEK